MGNELCRKDISAIKINENYKDRNVDHGPLCAFNRSQNKFILTRDEDNARQEHSANEVARLAAISVPIHLPFPGQRKRAILHYGHDSVVHSIIYDEKKGKATGVRVIDANTKQATEYFAKIIFVNAACLNSNLVLLNSTSNRFPNGLGNDNGLLGKYVAFHNYRGTITATLDGF